MANIRKCIICGEKYEYCIHCGDAKKEEPWRYLYHDEKCRAIDHAWRALKGNEILQKDFIDILNNFSDHTAAILKNDSAIARGIKEVYGVKKEQKPQKNNRVVEATESVAEKTVEEPKTVEEEKHEEPKAVKITRNKK